MVEARAKGDPPCPLDVLAGPLALSLTPVAPLPRPALLVSASTGLMRGRVLKRPACASSSAASSCPGERTVFSSMEFCLPLLHHVCLAAWLALVQWVGLLLGICMQSQACA